MQPGMRSIAGVPEGNLCSWYGWSSVHSTGSSTHPMQVPGWFLGQQRTAAELLALLHGHSSRLGVAEEVPAASPFQKRRSDPLP